MLQGRWAFQRDPDPGETKDKLDEDIVRVLKLSQNRDPKYMDYPNAEDSWYSPTGWIAKKVGRPKSTVNSRLEKLERKGIVDFDVWVDKDEGGGFIPARYALD